MQLKDLHKQFDELQLTLGDPTLKSIYWAGCISTPKVCLVFMNPTARNLAAHKEWSGIRAPWIWLKQTWKMLYELWFISQDLYLKTQASAVSWNNQFAEDIYSHLANEWVYITNLAKCTQADAGHLKDNVFKEYLPFLLQEINTIRPQKIITFGNQVSSIMLGRPITVGSYDADNWYEDLHINNESYKMYPCWYPVGMGYRNIHKAMARLGNIMNS